MKAVTLVELTIVDPRFMCGTANFAIAIMATMLLWNVDSTSSSLISSIFSHMICLLAYNHKFSESLTFNDEEKD